jgi:hypothetical protein
MPFMQMRRREGIEGGVVVVKGVATQKSLGNTSLNTVSLKTTAAKLFPDMNGFNKYAAKR